MRHTIIALALLTAACESGNVPEQAVAETQSPQAGASVADIRAAPTPKRPESPYVTTAGVGLEVETATLVDVATGCQYTVRTLYQEEVEASPRNEPSGAGVRQLCGEGRSGGTPFVTLAGGSLGAVKVAIVTDRGTGCQEIVGTLFQNSMFATPRMEASGSGRRQVCGR